MAALVFLPFLLTSAALAGTPAVSIEPSESWIQPGEPCTLRVLVDGAVDSLSCMEVKLTWDPGVLAFEGALEGLAYGQASFSTFFDWEQTAEDTVLAVDCVLGYRSYVLAPGELVRFVFGGAGEGLTQVGITGVQLWDIDREPLDVDIAGPAVVHVSMVTGDTGTPAPGGIITSHPNPFNPSTTIRVVLGDAGTPVDGRQPSRDFEISIFDTGGRLVSGLFRGGLGPGTHEFRWNGRDRAQRPCSSGVYFAVASSEGLMLKRKLILLR